ncbi:MAG: hypothetical protein M3008_11580 [Chloroflexota bacterium]|nr:hypothetical protein [Chloroflexota bacterium]
MTGIPQYRSDAWGDLDNLATRPIAYVLMQEAIVRIVEPYIARYENTVLNTWDAFCREHLAEKDYETAREYHRLMESMPVIHSAALLELFTAMAEGMRIGVIPTRTLEENFQRVCRASGLSNPWNADDLMEDEMDKEDLKRFRALFPDVQLGITTKEDRAAAQAAD